MPLSLQSHHTNGAFEDDTGILTKSTGRRSFDTNASLTGYDANGNVVAAAPFEDPNDNTGLDPGATLSYAISVPLAQNALVVSKTLLTDTD